MSGVIHVWQSPVPETIEDAERFIFKAQRLRCEQNPLFQELACLLTARFPCITTIEDLTDPVWSDGPLDGECDEDVFTLGVRYQHFEKVLPFVVSTANQLGLTVYDMQFGKAYLPSGVVLEGALKQVPFAKLGTRSKPWWQLW